MAVLFGLTTFAGAALLFAVEPMAAKALLPLLGGTASVWSTCLAFFQAALLLGYLYAHASSRLSPRLQAVLHLLLLGSCVLSRPAIVVPATDHPPSSSDPTAWLLGRLATTLGLPFVVLAATSTLLQRWYASSRPPGKSDPYPLYAASNLGSLLALIAYPLAMEPALPLPAQARAWRWGFAGFAVLMIGCAATTIGRSRRVERIEAPPAVTRRDWALWVALAFIPSSLLQGVTTYLTTDIAPIPLLWVVPLALYLLSFVLTFASRPILPHPLVIRSLPIAALLLLPPLAAGLVQWFWMPVHLLFFFVAALACHGELARRRPAPGALTSFYLALAFGGVLGSLFNALLAPILFDRTAEYPIAIVLACIVPALDRPAERLRPGLILPGIILALVALLSADVGGLSAKATGAFCVSAASGLFLYVAWTHRRRSIAFSLSVGAVLLGTGLSPGVGGQILRRERNFYGILRVTEDDRAHARRLFHGWTLHGQQSTEPGREREPTTYYLPGGPASQVFGALNARPGSGAARFAVVGLGIGGLAPYARPGQDWTFYELDPAVEAVARDARLFTYLRDCPASTLRVVLGDARLRLGDAPDLRFDLIVLDAFSSDAIPVHLLTREALALYLAKRTPGGLLAYHISTSHLDLEPILGALAKDRGMVARIRRDLATPEEKRSGKQSTVWVVLADSEGDLGPIAEDHRWTPARAGPSVWTDDRSSLLDALAVGRGARGQP